MGFKQQKGWLKSRSLRFFGGEMMDFTTQRVLSARIGIEVPNMGLQA
jgi:hypothetical protein